jgi:hypothetical protein
MKTGHLIIIGLVALAVYFAWRAYQSAQAGATAAQAAAASVTPSGLWASFTAGVSSLFGDPVAAPANDNNSGGGMSLMDILQ